MSQPAIDATTLNGLTFSSAFDSGNATRVEALSDTANDEFILWTRRDCEGTPYENGCRTWFHFSVRGAAAGRTLAFRIHGMNSQGNLFRHDMRPSVRSLPSKPTWERLSTAATFWGGKSGDKYREMRENRAYDAESDHEGFVLRFEHTVDEAEADSTLYFAFCFPSTYTDTIARLAWLDHEFGLPFARVGSDPLVPTEEAASEAAASAFRAALAAASSSGGITPSEESDARAREIAKAAATLAPIGAPSADAPVGGGGIYYHRELLTRSLDGRRIDLLTISGTNGMLDHTDEELAPLADAALPRATSEEGGTRARAFRADKPVFLLTSRVHPGETPASHVLDGALEFLLDPTDPRAAALRERFVFKLVPLINPDGVYRGNYRSDNRGVNLNRVYLSPEPHAHPAVFAITALVAQLHAAGRLQFYVDCHAHSNKRGCFLFGNALADAAQMGSNVLYAKLAEANCRWFDFEGCVFSQSNMAAKDHRDGAVGKEGSGRVGVYRLTGLTHIYTLECNYNMGRKVNRLLQPHVPASMDQDRSLSPQPALRCLSPKYGPEMWRNVGKALAISALDMLEANPCSRLGEPGGAMAAGLARLRSTVNAWVRTSEHKEREKAAKKAAKKAAAAGGSDDDDGASDGGSDGGGGEEPSAGGKRRAGATSLEEMDPLRERQPSSAAVQVASTTTTQGDKARAAGGHGGGVAASAHACTTVPYWAQVRGTPLVRKGFSLRTPPAGRLEAASRVVVVEKKAMLDGALRGAIALEGAVGEAHGWMTLVMRDGVENATVMEPQPPIDGAAVGAAVTAEVEPVAASEAKGGMAFVF